MESTLWITPNDLPYFFKHTLQFYWNCFVLENSFPENHSKNIRKSEIVIARSVYMLWVPGTRLPLRHSMQPFKCGACTAGSVVRMSSKRVFGHGLVFARLGNTKFVYAYFGGLKRTPNVWSFVIRDRLKSFVRFRSSSFCILSRLWNLKPPFWWEIQMIFGIQEESKLCFFFADNRRVELLLKFKEFSSNAWKVITNHWLV